MSYDRENENNREVNAFIKLFTFPDILIDYSTGPRRKFPPGAKRVEVRTDPKISRNSPCSCGSGLKAKKCCLK